MASHRGDHRDPLVGELGGHRVRFGVEADQRQRVHAPRLDPRRDERLGRDGQQRPPFLGEQVRFDGGLAPQPPRQVLPAVLLEPGVERLQAAADGRDRDEEVAPGVADERLDVPLPVGPPHPAEVVREEVVALQPQELPGGHAATASGDLGHGDLEVVVADAAGDAAEELEGPGVALQERLGALAREGVDEDGVGVRQRHDEQRHPGRPAVERDLGLAEVDLGLARGMGQREDLGGPGLPGGDGCLDDRLAALVAVSVRSRWKMRLAVCRCFFGAFLSSSRI
jgi:hypothetical protein